MPTIEPVDLETAPPASFGALRAAEQHSGRSMNMLRTLANSPAMLDAYLHFFAQLDETELSPKLRALLTIAAAQEMRGEYMLAASSAFAAREGVDAAEIESSRRASSDDPKTAAALQFTSRAIARSGHLPASDVLALRIAGYSDREIVEIVALAGLNVWRNLFNLVAQTTVDFPPVALGDASPARA